MKQMKWCAVALMGLLGFASLGFAQDSPAGKTRLAIGPVKILPSLHQQLSQNGQLTLVKRAAESIDSQLIDALQNTRKFEIVARSDMDEILQEQRIAQKATTQPGNVGVSGADYLVLSTIDDFVDLEQSSTSPEMNMSVGRRTLRISSVVKIYNATNGVLIESMSVPVQVDNTGVVRMTPGDRMRNASAADDSVYVEMVNQMSMRVAQRVTDTLYPAKVIAVIGENVTVNRGAGTMINRGEVWEVFAVGNQLKDPDTGELLGREEIKMGEIVINDIQPRLSKGKTYGENRGIAPGQVARVKLETPQQPQSAPVAPAAPARLSLSNDSDAHDVASCSRTASGDRACGMQQCVPRELRLCVSLRQLPGGECPVAE